MVQFINEIWKPIRENPIYLVSNYGRVRTIDHPVWCKVNNSYSIRKGILCSSNTNNAKHYCRVGIQINNKRKEFAVHRLVAEAFIPNPNNYNQVNHIDGNKENNCVSNLEWCTNGENGKHAWDTGLRSKEKASKNSALRKLTEEQVRNILKLYNETSFTKRGDQARFCKEQAALYNLKSPNTIFWIIKGGTNKFINQDIVQTTNEEIQL